MNAHGNTIEAGDRYWKRMTEPVPDNCTEAPPLAVKEIGVRIPRRDTGAARRIHDELLRRRVEGRVTRR